VSHSADGASARRSCCCCCRLCRDISPALIGARVTVDVEFTATSCEPAVALTGGFPVQPPDALRRGTMTGMSASAYTSSAARAARLAAEFWAILTFSFRSFISAPCCQHNHVNARPLRAIGKQSRMMARTKAVIASRHEAVSG
jgi:hypothetical protein